MIARRLGPYELVAPLGAGGMGEVWRARDPRLGREVAIKVLPAEVARDPERVARFEREARAISHLSHPNLCALHDVGRQDGTAFLVMELLVGETLAARLGRGPLPLAEALRHGVEVAEALDAAHRGGIVHRDLKPGNVMLTKGGAKLMDFGLARPVDVGLAGALDGDSPTASRPLTAEGALVGTFQYMSPEQLEGKEADARSDIWALGCVLYEMATGSRAFAARSQASLIAAILEKQPPAMAELQPLAPPALERLVRHCLEKDPDERWQSARDVASELRWVAASSGEPTAPAPTSRPAPRRRERAAWAVAAGMAAAALTFGVLALRPGGRGGAPPGPLQVAIVHDGPGAIEGTPANVAISPDGRRLAYVVEEGGTPRLWVRDLDRPASRRVSDSLAAQLPFWSPDGRWLAFFSEDEPQRLWKVPAEGGPAVSVCPVTLGVGGTWSRDDVIVFASTAAGPLSRVAASGGSPEPVTVLDATRRETGHRMPWFLPDGEHFLFATLPRVGPDVETFVGSLRSKEVKRVVAASSGVTWAAPGHLLFERDRRLVAQRFDLARLELAGEPVPIGEPSLAEAWWEATWMASASSGGRLATLRSWPARTDVEWVDRSGSPIARLPLPAGRWQELAVAPDGRAVLAGHPVSAIGGEIWRFDSDGTKAERVGPRAVVSFVPVWAPDGQSFAFTGTASGRFEIYLQAADRAEGPRLVPTVDSQFKFPLGLTQGGSTLVLAAYGADTGWEVWTAPVGGDGEPVRVLRATGRKNPGAAVSPDGRWLAYVSYESGQSEVYVTSFPTVGPRTRVSTSGGTAPAWTRAGRELLYLAAHGRDSALVSVAVETGSAFRAAAPRPLLTRRGFVSFAAAPDGERLLLSTESGDTPPPYIALTLDWAAALRSPGGGSR